MKSSILFILSVCYIVIVCSCQNNYNFTGYAHQLANGKWGFINEKGEEIISYKYDHALDFQEGLAAVKMGSKYGYINMSGAIVIPLKYDAAESFHNKVAKV